jgi:hypothetical protein
VPPPPAEPTNSEEQTRGAAVFLNIPYDHHFTDLFLAYIGGLAVLGLSPRTTLEIVGGERRLDRTFDLIQRCRYSVHDLSRAELDAQGSGNAPFQHAIRIGPGCGVAADSAAEALVVRFRVEFPSYRKIVERFGRHRRHIHHGRPSGVGELTNA